MFLKIFLALVSVGMGVLSTIQGGMNGRMNIALDCGMYVLFFTFSTGIFPLLLCRMVEVLLVKDPSFGNTTPSSFYDFLRRILYFRKGAPLFRLYYIYPPFIGVAFVSAITYLSPSTVLSLKLTFVLQICAQLVSSLLIDHFGWQDVAVNRINLIKIVGIVLCIGGAIMVCVSQIIDYPPSSSTGLLILYVIIALVTGFILPYQTTYNIKFAYAGDGEDSVPDVSSNSTDSNRDVTIEEAREKNISETNDSKPTTPKQELGPMATPLMTMLFMYMMACVITFVIVVIYSLASPDTFYSLSENVKNVPEWCWITFLVGVVFITLGLFVVPVLGVAIWMGLMLVGQLVSSLITDHYDVFGLGKAEATALPICGIFVLLIGVAVLQTGGWWNKRVDAQQALSDGSVAKSQNTNVDTHKENDIEMDQFNSDKKDTVLVA